MEISPSISPHRWKSVFTQTQSYNVTITTYLTDLFLRYLYRIHPTCLSEISIKPLSLGFLSARWSAIYLFPYIISICNITTTCVAAKFPFSLPQLTYAVNRQW